MVTSPEVSLFPVMSCWRAILGGTGFTFPMWFLTATTHSLTLILSLTPGLTLREFTSQPLLDGTMFTDTFNLQLFASGGLIDSMAASEWCDFQKGSNKDSFKWIISSINQLNHVIKTKNRHLINSQTTVTSVNL